MNNVQVRFSIGTSGRDGWRCCACNNFHPRFDRCVEHTGTDGASRPSPRNGFTTCFALFPENGSFASVACASYHKLGASTGQVLGDLPVVLFCRIWRGDI
jgi:hypothetical protein